MAARVVTVAFQGVKARRVDVEVQFTSGEAKFFLVGMGDKAISESRERVRAAFSGLGLSLPSRRIIANLAPADLPKEGSHYDLPIALAIMAGMGVIPPDALAAWAGDTRILAAPSLIALVNHFRGTQILSPPKPGEMLDAERVPDLREVKGQENAKRALEIAAAGGQLTRARPFRTPHHSASMAALTGGGLKAKPGEVSLAHNGVLFLDELPEFGAQALDSLRQPIETGEVVVARANAHIRYPARFQLVAAMNPCRCGVGGAGRGACGRAPRCQTDYQGRISGPLMDRIDLQVEVPPVTAADLALPLPAEGTAQVAARVAAARELQLERAAADGETDQPLNAQ